MQIVQGVGVGTGSQDGPVHTPGLFTGAFRKYRPSLWQPDWGKPRRRSRSYIQVCIWHMSPALVQRPSQSDQEAQGEWEGAATLNTGSGVLESGRQERSLGRERKDLHYPAGIRAPVLGVVLLWREGLR